MKPYVNPLRKFSYQLSYLLNPTTISEWSRETQDLSVTPDGAVWGQTEELFQVMQEVLNGES